LFTVSGESDRGKPLRKETSIVIHKRMRLTPIQWKEILRKPIIRRNKRSANWEKLLFYIEHKACIGVSVNNIVRMKRGSGSGIIRSVPDAIFPARCVCISGPMAFISMFAWKMPRING